MFVFPILFQKNTEIFLQLIDYKSIDYKIMKSKYCKKTNEEQKLAQILKIEIITNF